VSTPEPGRLSTADWATQAGSRWLACADQTEARIAPVSDVLFAAAALQPGERVLDVGCGRGPTTRRAAELVGSAGLVVGLDVAQDLLAAAADMPVGAGAAPIEWVAADAQRAAPPRTDFDVVLSRFGVMFFDDAVAAFANLRGATRPGGRLTVAVWQPRERSAIHEVPLRVALAAAEAAGTTLVPLPGDAGPYSFGIRDIALDVLDRAGWSDPTFTPHVLQLPFAPPGADPAFVATSVMGMGAVEALLRPASSEVRSAVQSALEAAVRDRLTDEGVILEGAIAILHGVNA
jgi:SAM-dependent methyltransferase